MVSVALATYNGETFINDQVSSIVQQLKDDDELIICDDQSTDKTISILNNLKQHIGCYLSITINEIRQYPRKNFFKTIQLCSGDIIFLSDQDDIWLPNKVEKIVSYFELHPDIDIVVTDALLLEEKDWMVNKTVWKIFNFAPSVFHTQYSLFKFLMLFGNFTPGATMALRKSALSYLLPYDTATNYWHDEWLIFLAAAKGKLGLIDEPLIKYRVHDNQQVGLGSKDDFEARIKHVNHVLAKDINAENANGLLGIYWSAYQRALFFEKKSRSNLGFSDDLLKIVYELKFGYLKQLPFFKRYYLVLRWLYSGLYKTQLQDIFLV